MWNHAREESFQKNARMSIEGHQKIISELRAGKKRLGMRILREHIMGTKARIRKEFYHGRGGE
jgi:DNA-binding GntR family transcriptional regulator